MLLQDGRHVDRICIDGVLNGDQHFHPYQVDVELDSDIRIRVDAGGGAQDIGEGRHAAIGVAGGHAHTPRQRDQRVDHDQPGAVVGEIDCGLQVGGESALVADCRHHDFCGRGRRIDIDRQYLRNRIVVDDGLITRGDVSDEDDVHGV